MYFWKIAELEKDLKEGLPQSEDMKYLLALMMTFAIGYSFTTSAPNMYDHIVVVLSIIFVIAEVLLLYKFNNGKKGINFLSRYCSIGLVVGIRSIIFLMIPIIILLIIGSAILSPNYLPESTSMIDVIFMFSYFVGYIYMQIQSFKRINN